MSPRRRPFTAALSGNVDALPAARSNSVIANLTTRKSALDEQYAEALDQYGPNFPKVLRIAAQQKEVEADLAKARKTMVESVEEDFATARTHADLLQEALNKQKGKPTVSPKNSCSITFCSTMPNRISSSTMGFCKNSKKQVSPPACVPATFAWWIPRCAHYSLAAAEGS